MQIAKIDASPIAALLSLHIPDDGIWNAIDDNVALGVNAQRSNAVLLWAKGALLLLLLIMIRYYRRFLLLLPLFLPLSRNTTNPNSCHRQSPNVNLKANIAHQCQRPRAIISSCCTSIALKNSPPLIQPFIHQSLLVVSLLCFFLDSPLRWLSCHAACYLWVCCVSRRLLEFPDIFHVEYSIPQAHLRIRSTTSLQYSIRTFIFIAAAIATVQ